MTIIESVEVPEGLLKSPGLSLYAKVVWIGLLLDSKLNPGLKSSKSRLAKLVGLTRATVYKCLEALKATGWLSDDKQLEQRDFQGRKTKVFLDLFLDVSLSVGARLLHGILKLDRGFLGNQGKVRYSILSKELGMDVKTVRRIMGELAKSNWLDTVQPHKHAPVSCKLRHPVKEQFVTLEARIRRELSFSKNKGEGLMKAYLSVICPSDEYWDNSKHGFLRNPNTDCTMEFDRMYGLEVAFEFNGAQHYTATDRYDDVMVQQQKARDIIKKQICETKGITLITIHAEDLTFEGMLAKVGNLLPRRPLWSAGPIIAFLDKCSAGYRNNTPLLNPEA